MPLQTKILGIKEKWFVSRDEAIKWAKKTLTGDAANETEQKRFCDAAAQAYMPPASKLKVLFDDNTGAFTHFHVIDEDGNILELPTKAMGSKAFQSVDKMKAWATETFSTLDHLAEGNKILRAAEDISIMGDSDQLKVFFYDSGTLKYFEILNPDASLRWRSKTY